MVRYIILDFFEASSCNLRSISNHNISRILITTIMKTNGKGMKFYTPSKVSRTFRCRQRSSEAEQQEQEVKRSRSQSSLWTAPVQGGGLQKWGTELPPLMRSFNGTAHNGETSNQGSSLNITPRIIAVPDINECDTSSQDLEPHPQNPLNG